MPFYEKGDVRIRYEEAGSGCKHGYDLLYAGGEFRRLTWTSA
jgi:hypothetical protein